MTANATAVADTTGEHLSVKGVEPRPRVAFLGPVGTYTHQAALAYFGGDAELIPYETIPDVFRALTESTPPSQSMSSASTANSHNPGPNAATASGSPQYAMVPYENSTYGPVLDSFERLSAESTGSPRFTVVGKINLPIQHCIMASPRNGEGRGGWRKADGSVKWEDVGLIVSHKQALGQCATYLDTHLPHARRTKVPSTAYAARLAAGLVSLPASSTSASIQPLSDDPVAGARRDVDGAGKGEGEGRLTVAICSEVCAQAYGLEVLAKSVQDRDDNTTRFLALSSSSSS